VDQVCNPSYLGGRDHEDYCSRPNQAKISRDPPSQTIKAGHGGTCLSSQLCGDVQIGSHETHE
jgi:hypothetical protein